MEEKATLMVVAPVEDASRAAPDIMTTIMAASALHCTAQNIVVPRSGLL